MCYTNCPFLTHDEYRDALDRYMAHALGVAPTTPIPAYHDRLRRDLRRYERAHPDLFEP